MNDIAEVEATRGKIAEQLGASGRSALAQLPEEHREPVAFFWWSNRHLLPSLTPLVLRLKVWVNRYHLSADELRKALHMLTDPDVQAGHQFANQFHTDLARAVGEVVREKKRLSRTLAMRRAAAKQEAAAVVPDWPDHVQQAIDRIRERAAERRNPGGTPPPQPRE